MGRLTTHVLDTAAGAPAEGLAIELFRLDDGETRLVTTRTNADGRVDRPLLEGDAMAAGVYELRFHAGEYLRQRHHLPEPAFLDVVPIRFGIAAPGAALPRAAAALAVRLFHLSGKLMRPTIRFIRKSRLVELVDVDPTTTLLDYLRENEHATGTKEGCGEGDCGACTVAIGCMRDGRLVYEPVNACIQLLGQVDGCEVVTVEDLAAADGTLHPIQREMVERHASQCGFCTPGFVMALFAMYQSTDREVTREQVNDWIAGNLCRCTGYRPIVDAAVAACARGRHDRFITGRGDMSGVLTFLADNEDVFVGDEDRFFAAPTTLDGLADLYERHPDATIVAGGTDVGLWITKQLRDLPKIIHVGKVLGPRPDRRQRPRVDHRRRRHLRPGRALSGRARPGYRRAAAPAGLQAGACPRHRRRQRRQRLADRRHPAHPDRPRRDAVAASRAARCARWRSRNSTSPTASRRASAASC